MRVRPFLERAQVEHPGLLGNEEALRARVEEHAPGPRSKEILLQTLEHESTGHLAFASFLCPPVIDHGVGATLWDVDGNEYVDCQAGFAVCALGHGNEEVTSAIHEQLKSVAQYAEQPFAVRARISERMAAYFPGNGQAKVFHSVTGGEAVEIAIKLARWYTGKTQILTQYGDYHGRTAGAMGLSNKAFMTAYQWPMPAADSAVFRFPFAYCYRCPYGKTYPECELHCVDVLEQQFDNKELPFRNPGNGVSNVAGMIIEPFQSSGGYIIPPDGYHEKLKALADAYEFLFIVDEVQTGMGRTGKMWAIEHSGVQPDALTTGKAIANGLPVSMVVGDAELMDSYGPGGHSTTFAGYAAGAAGANAVLDIFERDDILGSVQKRGEYFLSALRKLEELHPSIGQVQGKGLYLAVELVRDRKTKEPASAETAWAHHQLLRKGVICMVSGYHGNRLMFGPPLVISEAEIDRATSVLDDVIGMLEQGFSIGEAR